MALLVLFSPSPSLSLFLPFTLLYLLCLLDQFATISTIKHLHFENKSFQNLTTETGAYCILNSIKICFCFQG
jgi:hypothetical protein